MSIRFISVIGFCVFVQKEAQKTSEWVFSQHNRGQLIPHLCCAAVACQGPGDCIFTAALTAVAFHSGDRWRAFSPYDTESLQSSALMDLWL